MKRRFAAIAVSSATLILAAVPARSEWWNPISSTIEEYLYQPIAGTVKVPWIDDCPSFSQWATADEKQRTLTMAQLAGHCYLDGDVKDETIDNLGYGIAKNGNLIEQIKAAGFQVDASGAITLKGAEGFAASIYTGPGGETVLAFRGTEMKDVGDIATDIAQASGSKSDQYEAASKLLGAVLANTFGHISVTGHSLGGGLTQYAMAANNLQGRVSGYTYNSAGLSDDTVKSLPASGIAAAGGALINVRNDGDPVSFFESHIGNIYDLGDEGMSGSHSILAVIDNLKQVPKTNGPGLAYAPKAGGSNSLADSLDFLGNALDSFLPSEISGPLKSLIDQYVRAELLKAAGQLDAKALQKLAELKAKLDKMLPDDASRAAVNEMIGDVVSGNWENLSESAKEAAFAISDHYILEGLDKLGLGKAEKEAILKAYHDAATAWMNGGNVGETIVGNFESYIYNKIKSEVGEKAADSWKGVWTDIKAGTDPWADFGKATLDTIEFVGMRELQQGLDKYFNGVLKNNPKLAEFFKMCGIDTASVMALAKNIWGVLRGEGSIGAKLEAICSLVSDQLDDWIDKFFDAAFGELVQKAFDMLADIVEWVCSKAHELIEKADGWMEKQFDRGFDQDFTSMLEYANAVAAEEAGNAILVTDFAVDGMVEFKGRQDVQNQKTKNVHDEAF